MKLRAYVTSLESPDLSLCPELSASRSLPRLELLRKGMDRRLTKSTARLVLPQVLSEIDEVVGLSQWPRKHEGGALAHAELAQFRERFGDIDRIMSERRGKASLPPLSGLAGQDRKYLDITRRRAEKVRQEQELQARHSYLRHYEDELQTAELAAKARLQSLNDQREALRKHNTFIHNQLMLAELKANEEPVPSLKDMRHLLKSKSTLKPRNSVNFPTLKSTVNCFNETKEGFEGNQGEATVNGKNETREKSDVNQDNAIVEIIDNSKKAKEVDTLVKKTKEELNAIRSAQISHYYAVLKEGKDTRSEGLLWVVKRLWGEEQKTPLERFPAFLEDTTITIVIELAELSSEIDQLRVQMEILNKGKKGVAVFARCHTDKWNGVQKRLESLDKTTTLSKKIADETTSAA